MRNIKLILTLLVVSFIATSCSDDKQTVPTAPVQSKNIKNFHAPQVVDRTTRAESGEFTKFSFKTGAAVTTGNNWDIAFRGTRILVNGGAKIGGITDEPERTGNASLAVLSGTFSNITTAPADNQFKQDAAGAYALPWGSDKGWYNYSGPPRFLITPLAGKVIVVKTVDGNYAKMEIISYYKDNDPTKRGNSRYYTFNYTYNPNVGDKSIQ